MSKIKIKEMLRRNYTFAIRADESEDEGAIITGVPIVYNSPTDIGGMFEETIESGALDNADLTDVRFLVNHDTSKIPLARSRKNNGSSTMLLSVDEKGLSIRVKLDVENNTEARNLYSAIKRGDITGMSFMFGVAENGEYWEDINGEYPKRHITAISTVVEVSAVTFPAYEATEINARAKEAVDTARAAVDTAKANSSVELEKLKIEILYGGK